MRAIRLFAVLCLAAGARAAHAQAPASQEASKRIPIRITWDHKIAMRDGAKLSATIYRDPKQTKPWPALLAMTLYVLGGGLPKRVNTRNRADSLFVAHRRP